MPAHAERGAGSSVRAGGHQDPAGAQAGREMIKQVESRAVGPVQILERDQHAVVRVAISSRTPSASASDASSGRRRALLGPARHHPGQRGAERSHRRDSGYGCPRQSASRASLTGRRWPAPGSARPRRTAVPRASGHGDHLVEQPGLADAGLPGDHEQAARHRARRVEGVAQTSSLVGAADEAAHRRILQHPVSEPQPGAAAPGHRPPAAGRDHSAAIFCAPLPIRRVGEHLVHGGASSVRPISRRP